MELRQPDDPDNCATCSGRASQRTTVTIRDQTIVVDVPLCPACLARLTADDWMRVSDVWPPRQPVE